MPLSGATRRSVVVALGVAATLSSCRIDQPTDPSRLEPAAEVITSSDPVVVAAGDIVCGTGTSATALCQHAATAALIGPIAPAAVLLLGDNQYEDGSYADFLNFYHPTWGAYKDITIPAAGNHEYQTAGASGYFDYFNGIGVATGAAGDRSKGYYSRDIGSWHVVVLNSNCASVGGCGAGSVQEQWLRADLAAHTNACTMATWHHPRFSSGTHGSDATVQALWQALYDLNADLVLSGHDHDYERFAPQDAAGTLDNARGLRSFVVGTGGKDLRPFGTIRANSEVRNSNSLGIMKLTLHAEGYDWQFVPIPGHTLTDAGSATCNLGAPPPPPPPPPPATLTILASADAYTFQDKPKSNFGSATVLLVDASPAARTYFKFPVTGIGTKSVVSAVLRVYAVDPSNEGGRLHRVPSTTWSEKSIKWSNAPAYNAAILGAIGSVVINTWYEIDVTGQITGDGIFSFALESASIDGADYRSREAGAATAPRLVIVVQ